MSALRPQPIQVVRSQTYISWKELLEGILTDWALILIAAFVIINSLYFGRKVLTYLYMLKSPMYKAGIWIEDNYELAALVLVAFAFVTIRSYFRLSKRT